jgi:hypothetical protein
MDCRGLWRLSLDIRYCRREVKCSALSYRVSLACHLGKVEANYQTHLGRGLSGLRSEQGGLQYPLNRTRSSKRPTRDCRNEDRCDEELLR